MFDPLQRTKISYGGFSFKFGIRNYIVDHIEAAAAQAIRDSGLPIPKHIAFCMDGNRRFARKLSLEEGSGHIAGFESMMRMLLGCFRLGVKTVTVYAFSIENFNRSPEESEFLFGLVRTKLWNLVINRDSAINTFGWRIRFPGHRSMLEPDLVQRMDTIEQLTEGCDKMTVNICAPYTTRDDLTTAMLRNLSFGKSITMKSLEEQRDMGTSEKLDIFVRTSGETRLSDFMAWEIDSNCSVEFVPELWPEIRAWRLYRVVLKWQVRQAAGSKNIADIAQLPPPPPRVSVSKRSKKVVKAVENTKPQITEVASIPRIEPVSAAHNQNEKASSFNVFDPNVPEALIPLNDGVEHLMNGDVRSDAIAAQ